MDATLAALIGAGIGAVGPVIAALVAPASASRRAHKARQREIWREVYVDATQSFIEFDQARTVADLESVKSRIFYAQAQVYLLGRRRTSDRFLELTALIYAWIDAAVAEDKKWLSMKSPVARMQAAIPVEKRRELGDAYNAFIDAARNDMAMSDPIFPRWRRSIRRKRNQKG